LIILAIVLTMFTPTVFSFDIDSNWIRYSTLFSSFRIDTSTLELTIHPILELGADFPLDPICAFSAAIFCLVGGALQVVSAFTTSKVTLTKIFRIAGLSAGCLGIVQATTVLCANSLTIFPLQLSLNDFFSMVNAIPLAGFWIGIIGAILGVVSMKLTNWEDLG